MSTAAQEKTPEKAAEKPAAEKVAEKPADKPADATTNPATNNPPSRVAFEGQSGLDILKLFMNPPAQPANPAPATASSAAEMTDEAEEKKSSSRKRTTPPEDDGDGGEEEKDVKHTKTKQEDNSSLMSLIQASNLDPARKKEALSKLLAGEHVDNSMKEEIISYQETLAANDTSRAAARKTWAATLGRMSFEEVKEMHASMVSQRDALAERLGRQQQQLQRKQQANPFTAEQQSNKAVREESASMVTTMASRDALPKVDGRSLLRKDAVTAIFASRDKFEQPPGTKFKPVYAGNDRRTVPDEVYNQLVKGIITAMNMQRSSGGYGFVAVGHK